MAGNVPPHVPAELVVDLDIYDLPGEDEDVQLAWTQFQGHGPLVYSPYNGGHWVAVEASAIAAMFRNPGQFSSRSVTIPSVGGERMLPLEADPPDHGAYRKAVMAYLSVSRIQAMEPEVRALCIDLIEELVPRGGCEFISDFSHKLPLIILLNMLGLPLKDREHLNELTEIFARHPDLLAKQQAYEKLRHYLEDKITERRCQPGEDLISHLLASEAEGRPLTATEILSTVTMVTLAGLDTVASMLGFIALFLARNPEQREYIRAHKPQLAQITQELLRRFATSNMGRVVTEDMVYADIQLKKGDHIILAPTLHNLDPAMFPQPETVDFSRRPQHITFGTGNHVCAGAQLARMEIAIFLEEWLARIPEFHIDPARPVRARAGPVNTVDRLSLLWP